MVSGRVRLAGSVGLVAGLVVLPSVAPAYAGTAAVRRPSSAEPTEEPVRPLPRAASRLIVPPAAIGLVVGRDLLSADLRVWDGCGKELTLGRTHVDGDAAASVLPYQATGAGHWQVDWTARPVTGAVQQGRWTFDVVDGEPCQGADGSPAPVAGMSHHGGVMTPTSVGGFEPHPRLALILAGIAGAALLRLGWGPLRRSRRPAGMSTSELLVVVGLHATVLLTATGGEPWPVRLGLAVPGAVAVTGYSLRVVGHLRRRVLRALVSGLAAAAATLGVVGLWSSGRAVLMDAAPGDLLGAVPGPVLGASVVAGVLSAGGWYGSRRNSPG